MQPLHERKIKVFACGNLLPGYPQWLSLRNTFGIDAVQGYKYNIRIPATRLWNTFLGYPTVEKLTNFQFTVGVKGDIVKLSDDAFKEFKKSEESHGNVLDTILLKEDIVIIFLAKRITNHWTVILNGDWDTYMDECHVGHFNNY